MKNFLSIFVFHLSTMKMTRWFFIMLVVAQLAGCKTENDALMDSESRIKSDKKAALLSLSYEITTYQWYEYEFDKLTEVDLAHLNPSDEKQRVEMVLFPDGTVNSIIEEIELEHSINVKHQVLPNDMPSVKKTEIIGNTVNLYDINGKRISTQTVESPRQMNLVEDIKEMSAQCSDKELANAFSAMQGNVFDKKMEQIISEAETKGNLIEHDEQHATIRVNLSEIEPHAKGDCVTILDKKNKRIVASTIYDEIEKTMLRTFYGYTGEGAQTLDAVRTEQLIKLPSGAKAWQITCSKYENFEIYVQPSKN